MTTRALSLIALLLCLSQLHGFAFAAAADPESSESWTKIRALLFGARPIERETKDVLQLFLPAQAEDAAVVPVLIRTKMAQTRERYIKNLYLVIDNNPSPISATFHFTPDSGRADLETRVRVETYSAVRAIAETSDGELFMATKMIIASGGCSSPALKDEAGLRNLGKMKFSVEENEIEFGRPNLVQVMINHPNWSGLAINESQVQFIKNINVTYGDKLIMSAEVDFSISENPNFRFYFVPKGNGELKAEMVDSADLKYSSTLDIKKPGIAAADSKPAN